MNALLKSIQAIVLLVVAFAAIRFITDFENRPKTEANLNSDIPVVRQKTQDYFQRKNKEALYLITCYGKTTAQPEYQFNVILPEDFAEVNQHIYFRGSNMFAGPMEMETR